MRVISWNVNSIKARLERLLALLERHQPDYVCLQELKCVEANFPYEVLRDAGYEAYVYGQPTYNGVAVLSKGSTQIISKGFLDSTQTSGSDIQARWIHTQNAQGVHIISAYVPNGSEVGSDKYQYKLAWLERAEVYLRTHLSPSDAVIVCGDFNVALEARDVANIEQWLPTVLCHTDARNALRHLLDWGLMDSLRIQHPEPGLYSWWDYRALGFAKNNGLRIDHIYITQPLVDKVVDTMIDRNERKGQSPSDHAPVLLDLAI